MSGDCDADHWENDYSRRGRVWGGAVHHLPQTGAGERVLELGCGNGKSFSALAETKCDVVGIDFSPSAAILCRSLTPRNTLTNIALADVRSLPFEDASFDVVFAFHVIGHLPLSGRIRCAGESVRVLRPGGALYFSGFSVEDFRAGTGLGTDRAHSSEKTGLQLITFLKMKCRHCSAR